MPHDYIQTKVNFDFLLHTENTQRNAKLPECGSFLKTREQDRLCRHTCQLAIQP